MFFLPIYVKRQYQCEQNSEEHLDAICSNLRNSIDNTLCVYVILMLCSTLIFRETRTISHHGSIPFWHYAAFRQGRLQLLPELIMNVLAFIPIGFVFCLAFRRISWWQAAIVGMGLSIGIEFLQLVFKRGCADIDDVIHNTLGCLMGCCLYLAISRSVISLRRTKG